MIDLSPLLIDIEDQRHYNSCGGQAGTTLLEAVWKKFDGQAKEFSPAYLWQMAKKMRGHDYADNLGVMPVNIFDAMKRYGCALEADYPYTNDNLTREPPADVIKKAKANSISGYKSIKPDEIIQMLDKGLPVFVLVDMGGGHFVCIFGYRYEAGKLQYLIVNSWGVEWMEQGKAWINRDDLKLRSAWVITGLKWPWLKDAKKWFKSVFK